MRNVTTVGESPNDIAIDPNTKKVYVTNFGNNTVSVINGTIDKVMRNVTVGESPSGIAIDPNTQKVYVANTVSNTVSVIDEKNINLSKGPFLKDQYNRVGIKVDKSPNGIAIDPATQKVYVANTDSDTVSIIDGTMDTVNNNTIPVGKSPASIAIDPVTGKVYVANLESVSVIDSTTDKVMRNVTTVGKSPNGVAIDSYTGKVYVTNTDSDTVSVINGTTYKVMRNVTVGKSPSGIAIDSYTGKVYVTNLDSDTVSVIDGTIDRTVANIRFSISPINSGHIKCDKKDIATNQYHLMESYTQCTAEANNGFQFSSWTENLGHNSIKTISTATLSNSPINSFLSALGFPPKDNAAIFNVTQFGNFSANFKEVPPPIPPEYWIPLYGVIVSSIVGWSIPSIIGWIRSRKQGRIVHQYHKRIGYLYNDGKLDENDIEPLDKLKTDITDAYAKGKISEQQYGNLKNEISILYEEIYNKMITTLSDKSNKENGRLLNNLKNDITDAYAKGKISEQHYTLLNKKIPTTEENKVIDNSNKPSYMQETISKYQSQSKTNDFVQSVKTDSNVGNLLYYENSQLGIKIQYPAGWILHQKEYYPDHPSDIWSQVVGFSSDREIHTNSNLENVAIYVKTLHAKNISADTYSYRHINYISKKFTMIEASPIILAKNPGHKVLYMDKRGYDTIEVWTVQRNNVYTIKCTTKAQDRTFYLPLFQEIISSFQIIK
jgi:YVTN family beta-propeller protein